MHYPLKIKLIGAGGHGFKLLGTVLAKLMSDQGKETSLNLEYDSAVRGGNTSADIVIAESKIKNPVVEQPDLLAITSPADVDLSQVSTVLADESLELHGSNITSYPFLSIARYELESFRVANMIILGAILRFMGIDPASLDFSPYIKKSLELNLQAIKKGFDLVA